MSRLKLGRDVAPAVVSDGADFFVLSALKLHVYSRTTETEFEEGDTISLSIPGGRRAVRYHGGCLAVAVRGDEIFVANAAIDNFESAIRVYNRSSGKYMREFARSKQDVRFESLVWPTSLIFSDSSELFVCDHVLNRIQVYTRSGRLLRVFGVEYLAAPWRLAWTRDKLYVLETFGCVQVFKPTGEFLFVLREDCEFCDAPSFTIIDDHIYVFATNYVFVHALDGTKQRSVYLGSPDPLRVVASSHGELVVWFKDSWAMLQPDLLRAKRVAVKKRGEKRKRVPSE